MTKKRKRAEPKVYDPFTLTQPLDIYELDGGEAPAGTRVEFVGTETESKPGFDTTWTIRWHVYRIAEGLSEGKTIHLGPGSEGELSLEPGW